MFAGQSKQYTQNMCGKPQSFCSVAGTPEPLGPSKISESAKSGVNFALYSEHATSITLILSDREDINIVELPLDPAHHRTGNVWHAAVEGCPLSGVLYGYRVEGQTGWETGDR